MQRLLQSYLETEKLKGLKPATLYNKHYYLKRFMQSMAVPILKVTKDLVSNYIDSLSGLSPSFVNNMLQHIQAFYTFLCDEGKALINPALGIDRPKRNDPERSVFTEDEVKRILNVIPDDVLGRRDRALLELLYSTGLRVSEALSLTLDDIDFARHEVVVREGKGDIERVVPIGKSALKYVESYLEERLKRWGYSHYQVFSSQKGNPFKAQAVREMIAKYKQKANVTTPGSTHAFRRSCATHLLARGVPLVLIQQLLGHAYLETTHQYVQVAIQDLQNIHTKIFKEGQT
jgi:site-specific recombinase XerD